MVNANWVKCTCVPMEQADEEIALLVQQGNTDAFGSLVERYTPKLLRYARKFLLGREDAEDMVQEVFIKAYTNINSFDISRRFSPWVYRIAHNEFINAISRKEREPFLFFDPDELFPHPIAAEQTDRDIKDSDLKRVLDECLISVGAKYREVLVLYYYEELNYTDIADVLHLPVSTVGVRLKRGREALRKVYEKLNHL